ncbi:NAD(P)H-hydrate epimerase [Paenirhodobacter ferrireducens]|nr:NAD(P)H-hydrate epimerase [Sinirhodobacter ferrireducens]
MRAVERAAIEAGRVSGLALMERAGAGVVAAILETWPALAAAAAPPCAVVLCGPGNNGGDGFVVARRLAARGWRVATYLLGTPERLPPDARTNAEAWSAAPTAHALPAAALAAGDWTECRAGVVIDALYGLGFRPPLPAAAAQMLATAGQIVAAHPEGWKRVAIDIPSGLAADAPPQVVPACDLVVTFHLEKPVHPSLRAAGLAVTTVDIGL